MSDFAVETKNPSTQQRGGVRVRQPGNTAIRVSPIWPGRTNLTVRHPPVRVLVFAPPQPYIPFKQKTPPPEHWGGVKRTKLHNTTIFVSKMLPYIYYSYGKIVVPVHQFHLSIYVVLCVDCFSSYLS